MTRKLVWMALLIVMIAVVAGCGGGGGGSTPPDPTDNYTLTGTVRDATTNVAVVGAVVGVGTHTATTNSSGQFSISMTNVPTGSTFSVDGLNAGPAAEHYYGNWARYDNHWYSVHAPSIVALPLPGINNGTTSLGTIYLLGLDQIPPIPGS